MRAFVLLAVLVVPVFAHAAYPTDPVVFCPLDELTAGGAKDLVTGLTMTYHGTDTGEIAGDRTWKKLTGTNGIAVPASMLEGDRPAGFWRQAHTVVWWQYGPSASETGTLGIVGQPTFYYPFLAPIDGDFWFDDRYVRGFQVALFRYTSSAWPWGNLVPEFNSQTLNASWSLVSLRFDPTTLQMQVGKNTTEWAYTFPSTDLWGTTDVGKGRFLLGSDGTFTGGGTRLVGSLAIFNRVLSDAEVAEIHSLGPGFIPDYWGGGGEDPGGGPSDPGLALLLDEMERAADFLDVLNDTGEILRDWLKLLVTFILFGLGIFLFRLLTIARDRKKILGALLAVGIGGATADAQQEPPPCLVWLNASGPLNHTFVPQAGPYQETCISASHSIVTAESSCLIGFDAGGQEPYKVHKVVFLVKMHPVDNGANTENDWICKTVWLTVAQIGPVQSSSEKRHYARKANAQPGSSWREIDGGSWDRCGANGKYCLYAACAQLYSATGPFWPEGESISDLYSRLYEGWQDPCNKITKDTDGDGIPDNVDPDDDNDGVPDTEDEDDDGDGVLDSKDPDRDDDGDGIMNPDDPDDDNDGIPDDNDPDDDDDNDGIPNPQDPDDDNDGKPDGQDPDHPDGPDDGDGDGIPDKDDPDDDGDGVPDAQDPDDDNDGIPDDEEQEDDEDDEEPETDTDNDGIPDDTDLDDDNDGCLDPQDPNPKNAGVECNDDPGDPPDDDKIPGEDWQPGDREKFWHINCESASPWAIIKQAFMTRLVGNLDESGWRDWESWTEAGEGLRFPYVRPTNLVHGSWSVEYIRLTPTGEVTVPGAEPWPLTGWNTFADGVYTIIAAGLTMQFIFKTISAIAGGV